MRQLMLSVAAVSVLLSGCSYVNLSEKGEKIVVLKPEEVRSCTRLGSTVVAVKDSVAGIDRDQAKMDEELKILARNSAPDVAEGQADVVVREERLRDGKQRFGVYRCRP